MVFSVLEFKTKWNILSTNIIVNIVSPLTSLSYRIFSEYYAKIMNEKKGSDNNPTKSIVYWTLLNSNYLQIELILQILLQNYFINWRTYSSAIFLSIRQYDSKTDIFIVEYYLYRIYYCSFQEKNIVRSKWFSDISRDTNWNLKNKHNNKSK